MDNHITVTDTGSGSHHVEIGKRWYSVRQVGASFTIVDDEGESVSPNRLLGQSILRAIKRAVRKGTAAHA